MSDLPLALLQLFNMTAGELGLGEGDRHALELALTRAFKLGVTHANNEHARNQRDEPGTD